MKPAPAREVLDKWLTPEQREEGEARMPFFRKKPVTIEARKFDCKDLKEMTNLADLALKDFSEQCDMSNAESVSVLTFHFTTDEPLQTTEATMAYWVENFMSSRCEILLDDGSYMEIKTPNDKIWEVSARGGGDFTSHEIEFKETLERFGNEVATD